MSMAYMVYKKKFVPDHIEKMKERAAFRTRMKAELKTLAQESFFNEFNVLKKSNENAQNEKSLEMELELNRLKAVIEDMKMNNDPISPRMNMSSSITNNSSVVNNKNSVFVLSCAPINTFSSLLKNDAASTIDTASIREQANRFSEMQALFSLPSVIPEYRTPGGNQPRQNSAMNTKQYDDIKKQMLEDSIAKHKQRIEMGHNRSTHPDGLMVSLNKGSMKSTPSPRQLIHKFSPSPNMDMSSSMHQAQTADGGSRLLLDRTNPSYYGATTAPYASSNGMGNGEVDEQTQYFNRTTERIKDEIQKLVQETVRQEILSDTRSRHYTKKLVNQTVMKDTGTIVGKIEQKVGDKIKELQYELESLRMERLSNPPRPTNESVVENEFQALLVDNKPSTNIRPPQNPNYTEESRGLNQTPSVRSIRSGSVQLNLSNVQQSHLLLSSIPSIAGEPKSTGLELAAVPEDSAVHDFESEEKSPTSATLAQQSNGLNLSPELLIQTIEKLILARLQPNGMVTTNDQDPVMHPPHSEYDTMSQSPGKTREDLMSDYDYRSMTSSKMKPYRDNSTRRGMEEDELEMDYRLSSRLNGKSASNRREQPQNLENGEDIPDGNYDHRDNRSRAKSHRHRKSREESSRNYSQEAQRRRSVEGRSEGKTDTSMSKKGSRRSNSRGREDRMDPKSLLKREEMEYRRLMSNLLNVMELKSKIKGELKDWAQQFEEKNGRSPNAEDKRIVNDKFIAYKMISNEVQDNKALIVEAEERIKQLKEDYAF